MDQYIRFLCHEMQEPRVFVLQVLDNYNEDDNSVAKHFVKEMSGFIQASMSKIQRLFKDFSNYLQQFSRT